VILVTHGVGHRRLCRPHDRDARRQDRLGRKARSPRPRPSLSDAPGGASASPPQAAPADGDDGPAPGFPVDGLLRLGAGPGPQQAALGLTMLGVFIGVAALIAHGGPSATGPARRSRNSWRKPGHQHGGGPAGRDDGRRRQGRRRQRLDPDGDRRRDPFCATTRRCCRSAIWRASPARFEYGDQNWTTAIQGVTPSYLDIVSWRIAEGATMTEQENDTAETVCLIGQTVYQNLFGPGEEPRRRGHPGQGRADAGDRRAGLQGPDGFRSGPGRPGDDPVHHRRAQGAGVAAPQASQSQVATSLPAGAERLRPHPAHDRLT